MNWGGDAELARSPELPEAVVEFFVTCVAGRTSVLRIAGFGAASSPWTRRGADEAFLAI